jgi:hypothetical protein
VRHTVALTKYVNYYCHKAHFERVQQEITSDRRTGDYSVSAQGTLVISGFMSGVTTKFLHNPRGSCIQYGDQLTDFFPIHRYPVREASLRPRGWASKRRNIYSRGHAFFILSLSLIRAALCVSPVPLLARADQGSGYNTSSGQKHEANRWQPSNVSTILHVICTASRNSPFFGQS